MKTLSEIVNREPVFLHDWENKIDMVADFEGICISSKEYHATESPYSNINYWIERKEELTRALDKYKDINILFASYGTDNYSGDAFVLFEKDRKIYEVHGSHCSCYGLEGQFEPEETSLEYLEYVLKYGTLGVDNYAGNEFKEELSEFLGIN